MIEKKRRLPNCIAPMWDDIVLPPGRRNPEALWNVAFSPIDPIIPLLKFLCCRDVHKEQAWQIWNEIDRLAVDAKGKHHPWAVEFVAHQFVFKAIEVYVDLGIHVNDKYWPPKRHRTREELEAADKNVATAAAKLRAAIIQQGVFRGVASSDFWPSRFRAFVSAILYGLTPPNGWWTELRDGAPIEKDEEFLAWLITSMAPTMPTLLRKLERQALQLAESRMKTRKHRQSTADANDTAFIRDLVLTLLHSYRDLETFGIATPRSTSLARIVTPVANRFLGGTNFERCKKLAQRLQREPSSQGTIRATP